VALGAAIFCGSVVPAAAQTNEEAGFVDRARAATAPYADRAVAIEEGYRRIGPEIPAMGEHWVQVRNLLDPSIDPDHPEILAYAIVDGEPRLVGIAYAVALRGSESPPDVPGTEPAWHAHDGPVEEELLGTRHAMADAGAESARIAVLHAWIWAPSPAGMFAPHNWALPAFRLGLPTAGEADDDAARALSLARGGAAFYVRQIEVFTDLDAGAMEGIEAALAKGGAAVDAWLAARPAGRAPAPEEREALGAIWRETWESIEAGIGCEEAEVVRSLVGPRDGGC
jgi:hypothetical protein